MKKHINITINWIKQNILIVLLITLYLELTYLYIKIPNFFRVNFQIVNTSLQLSTAVLSTILGILIAIILLAFELLKKTFTRYATKELFSGQKIKSLFVLYIFTIVTSLMTLITLINPLTQQNINTFYYLFVLTLYCLVSLFTTLKEIIIGTDAKSKINILISQIDKRSFRYFVSHNENNLSTEIKDFEENKLVIIDQILTNSIIENDNLITQQIIINLNKKIIEILKNLTKIKKLLRF